MAAPPRCYNPPFVQVTLSSPLTHRIQTTEKTGLLGESSLSPGGNPRYFELRQGGKVRTHGGAGRGPLSSLTLLQLSPIQLERNPAALYKTRGPARRSAAGHIETRNLGSEALDSRLGPIA